LAIVLKHTNIGQRDLKLLLTLKMYDNKVLRIKFGYERDKVTAS